MCVAVTISLPVIAADKDEDEIRALVPKIVQAWESLDPAKVDPYYATRHFEIGRILWRNTKTPRHRMLGKKGTGH